MKHALRDTDSPTANRWCVYIMQCADGTLYTGITTDPIRRLQEHNTGVPRGARYTHTRRPVTLAYTELALDRAAAARREWAIKQLDASGKRALCARWTSA